MWNMLSPLGGPVGYLSDGTPIWPVAGGDGDGDNTGGTDQDTGGAGDDGASGDADADADSDVDDPVKLKEALERARRRVKELSDENADRRVKGKTAQQQLDEALAKVKAIEDKDKSELDLVKQSLETVTAERDALKTAVDKLRIDNAFFEDNKYTWRNPKHALALADLSDVKIDEDGKVTGLGKALDKLAKDNAYMLADKDAGKGGSGGSSGPPNAGKVVPPSGTDRTAMEQRFPALRTRPQ
jgi:hypothetical protein